MNEQASAWESEDGVLLSAVADERDPVAYRVLFDRYYPRVFIFVQRRLGDRELAKEVVSDVFVEVWSSAPAFRGESKISSWIFGIARFKCLEAYRRGRRLKRSRVVATDDQILSQHADPMSSESRVDARQELARVAAVLGKLPAAQREALELSVVQGLDLEEVAKRQNVSKETVKTRISRARKGLRRMLGVSEG